MSQPWDDLKEGLAGPVRDTLSEFWATAGVPEFAEAKIEAFAREKWLSETAPTEAERRLHRENLLDLKAHVKDEALLLASTLSDRGKDLLGTVLKVAGGIVLDLAKSWLSSKVDG